MEVVVVTAHNEPAYRHEHVEGISTHYLPVPYDNRFGFYQRVISFCRFALKAVRMAAQHRDADLCYAISTPLTTGLAAYFIQRRYGIPYIFEVGDLWPDAPVALGFVKNGLLKAALYRMEKAIYRGAHALVALSPPIREAILRKVPTKTVHLIPNMADTDFFQPTNDPRREAGADQRFVVSYLGAIGFANGLQYMIDCAVACERESLPVHFFICGEGALQDELQEYASRQQVTNLTFVTFRNREGVRELMDASDACFISYLPLPILETGSPNKYFDALAAGKLVIINFGGWIREEVEREQCGVYVDPRDPADFARKIRAFVDDPARLRVFQGTAHRLARARYARTALSDLFVDMITHAIHSFHEVKKANNGSQDGKFSESG